VLSVRLGPIERVIYSLAGWVTAPRKLPTDERVVRLAAYDRQPVNTVEVTGRSSSSKIVLLVVPAYTDTDDAHHTMMAAAPDGPSTVEGLLLTVAHGVQRS
jgi:hypothetical protein